MSLLLALVQMVCFPGNKNILPCKVSHTRKAPGICKYLKRGKSIRKGKEPRRATPKHTLPPSWAIGSRMGAGGS
jgi:hypothetical protein